MAKEQMKKGGYLFVLIGMLIIVSAFRGDDIILGKQPSLIGSYEFICTYRDNVKTEASAFSDRYTLKINKKDELIIFKNGRKWNKYYFSDVEVPIDYDYEYVMFHKEDQFYPMFYKGDTVVLHLIPFEFQDNYFRKIKK